MYKAKENLKSKMTRCARRKKSWKIKKEEAQKQRIWKSKNSSVSIKKEKKWERSIRYILLQELHNKIRNYGS